MEKSSFGYGRCLKQESAQAITWIGQPETRFMFDHVACEGIDQVCTINSLQMESVVEIGWLIFTFLYAGDTF